MKSPDSSEFQSCDLEPINNYPILYGGHTDEVRTILISSDLRWMYTGSWDCRILKYPIEYCKSPDKNGEIQHKLPFSEWVAHQGSVTGLLELVPTNWIVSSSKDGTVKIWSTESNSVIYSFDTGHEKVYTFDMKWDHDHYNTVTGGSDGFVRLWDISVSSNQEKCIISHHLSPQVHIDFNAPIHVVKFHKKLPLFACSGDSNEIFLFSFPKGENIGKLTHHRKFIYTFDFHPVKPWVLSAGKEKKIFLQDTENHKLFEIPVPKSVSYLKFSPEGDFFLSVDFNNAICMYSTSNGELVNTFSWNKGTQLTVGVDLGWKLMAVSPFAHRPPITRIWNVPKLFPILTDIVGRNSRT